MNRMLYATLAVSLLACATGASAARTTETFKGEIDVCTSASPSCFGSDFVHFSAGSMHVSLRNRGYDERSFQYQVEFDNSSDCDVTIGSTMLRHGDTLNAETLDFGNIDLQPRQSLESGENNFTLSRSESEKYVSVKFTYHGIASCPK